MTDRKNSIWLSAQFIASVVMYLVTLKINILNYGEHDFGIWIVLTALWSFSYNLDFGIGTTVVRYVAKYRDDDINVLNKILSTSFVISISIGLALILFGYLASYLLYFTNTKVIAADRVNDFISAFLLFGPAFLMQYVVFFYKSIFEGMSNFVLTSKMTIIQSVMLLAGVLVLWKLHSSLIWLSALTIMVNAVILGSYIIFFRKVKTGLELRFSNYNKATLKEIVAFSSSVQAINIFYSLIDVVIKNIIANYYQASFATVYEISRKFAVAISGLFFSAFKYILPKSSALKNEKDISDFLKNDIIRYSKYGLIYSGLTIGVMSFPLALFIMIMFGNKAILVTFLILAMPEAINNYGYSIYTFILGQGKIHFLAFIQFLNLFITSISVMIGISIFKSPLGLLGYFISVTIGNALIVGLLKKQYHIDVLKLLKDLGIYKLVIFEGILFAAVIMFFVSSINYYYIFGTICLMSLFIFGRDIYVNVLGVLQEITVKRRVE